MGHTYLVCTSRKGLDLQEVETTLLVLCYLGKSWKIFNGFIIACELKNRLCHLFTVRLPCVAQLFGMSTGSDAQEISQHHDRAENQNCFLWPSGKMRQREGPGHQLREAAAWEQPFAAFSHL